MDVSMHLSVVTTAPSKTPFVGVNCNRLVLINGIIGTSESISRFLNFVEI